MVPDFFAYSSSEISNFSTLDRSSNSPTLIVGSTTYIKTTHKINLSVIPIIKTIYFISNVASKDKLFPLGCIVGDHYAFYILVF